MKTESEKLSPTRVKLTVEVPFDELKPAVEAATTKIADQVQIPGFRKGKVPSKLVEQRFGRPAIMQEAVNDALPDFYQQAAAEAELKPVGRPEVEVTEVPGLDGAVMALPGPLEIVGHRCVPCSMCRVSAAVAGRRKLHARRQSNMLPAPPPPEACGGLWYLPPPWT